MNCKKICLKYASKHSPRDGGRYQAGDKRCSSCEIFITWDGGRCPCCGCALRGKPRNSKSRERIVKINLKK